MKRMTCIAFVGAAISAIALSPVYAVEVPLAFLCGNIAGTYFGAPDWRAGDDAFSGQQVLLDFKGDGEISKVTWIKDGRTYYEAEGIGGSMKSGFSIVVFAESYIETYVFNVGTTELLFGMLRSGSSLLPNSAKSARGTCIGAAALVK